MSRDLDDLSSEEEFTTRSQAEQREIMTLSGQKKIHFTVTSEGEILITSQRGHCEVYNLNGEF